MVSVFKFEVREAMLDVCVAIPEVLEPIFVAFADMLELFVEMFEVLVAMDVVLALTLLESEAMPDVLDVIALACVEVIPSLAVFRAIASMMAGGIPVK